MICRRVAKEIIEKEFSVRGEIAHLSVDPSLNPGSVREDIVSRVPLNQVSPLPRSTANDDRRVSITGRDDEHFGHVVLLSFFFTDGFEVIADNLIRITALVMRCVTRTCTDEDMFPRSDRLQIAANPIFGHRKVDVDQGFRFYEPIFPISRLEMVFKINPRFRPFVVMRSEIFDDSISHLPFGIHFIGMLNDHVHRYYDDDNTNHRHCRKGQAPDLDEPIFVNGESPVMNSTAITM